jgi:hypothetical protein
MQDINKRGDWERREAPGSLWELSVLSAQFFYKPKTAPKNKIYLKNSLGPIKQMQC